jgi:hypothetical protein
MPCDHDKLHGLCVICDRGELNEVSVQTDDAAAGAHGNVYEGNPDFKCETCEGYASSPFSEYCDCCILEERSSDEEAVTANSDRDEGGANDLALGDAANGAGARSPFAQAAAADPDFPTAEDAKDRVIDMLNLKVAVLEAERDEALEKLAELDREPDRHDDNIHYAIAAGWIIPNWYKQEQFDAMRGWDQNLLRQFQGYLTIEVCGGYDFVRQGIEKVLEDFLNESDYVSSYLELVAPPIGGRTR